MYNYALSNPISVLLNKPKEDFTRDDLLKVIQERNIERITFHYTALDGKLKEMQIPLPGRKNAEIVLTEGERVDGSSLFKGLIDTALSDLYVVPIWKTAFFNPFQPASLDFICRYITSDGELAPFAPDSILVKASKLFSESTGLDLHAFGELEFYLFYKPDNELYYPLKQRGYHASGPYIKSCGILSEMLRTITQIVNNVKYAHSEVGFIEKIKSPISELNGLSGEQLEIELLSAPVEDAADAIVITKWLIRNIAAKYGMLATFTPKLEEGIAGNGMHIHLKLIDKGRNVTVNSNKELSEYSLKLIGGLCEFADSLTSFGNRVASSYLRLVPDQEAPTKICWSDSNRSALIRIPLGWSKINNLAKILNPHCPDEPIEVDNMQTVEFRSPDGSANSHLLLAGITMAVLWGFLNPEKSLELAKKYRVYGNIFKDKMILKSLNSLPDSCASSAEILKKKRHLYEYEKVFSKSAIDYTIFSLEKENDKNLRKQLSKLTGKNKIAKLKNILHKDLHKN